MSINETDLYYLWLGCACNFEPKLMDMCFNSMMNFEGDTLSGTYNSPEYIRALYENRDEIQSKIDKSNYNNSINLKVNLDEPMKIAEECQELGIKIITLCNKDYPNRLRNIYCPPKLIFVKGDISGVDDVLGISIVGTRSATKAGVSNIEKIAYDLSARGIIITSGMALGIDTAAHSGVLSAGGRTFAVLAGGVDVVYPAVNRDIYEMICENGAVISERPPHCIGQPQFYQQRNRIITGLSLGVVIAEGALKSGTSITARLALENNRDIFAIPNDIKLVQSQLPNSLIKEGAILIRNAEDILKQYKYIYPELEIENDAVKAKRLTRFTNIFRRVKNTKNNDDVSEVKKISEKIADDTLDMKQRIEKFYARQEYVELSETDKAIFEVIKENMNYGITADEVAQQLDMKISTLNSKLLMWQIKGLIIQTGGSKLYLKL